MFKKIKNIIPIISLLFTLSPNVMAESINKGAIICWSKDILKSYIASTPSKKRHMEEHSCAILQSKLRASVISSETIVVENKKYTVVNINQYYIHRNKEQTDNVWSFTKYINSK